MSSAAFEENQTSTSPPAKRQKTERNGSSNMPSETATASNSTGIDEGLYSRQL